jgi:uncharacterized short protein YbdD (DUF466 family)
MTQNAGSPARERPAREQPARANPVKRAAAWLWWYCTELTGENAYRRYAERARRADPTAAVLTRGEFERKRADDSAADPEHSARCC